MNKTILAIFMALSLAACASTGSQTGEGGEKVAAGDSEEKPKMRCYREKETGTRLGGKRVCVPADGD